MTTLADLPAATGGRIALSMYPCCKHCPYRLAPTTHHLTACLLCHACPVTFGTDYAESCLAWLDDLAETRIPPNITLGED